MTTSNNNTTGRARWAAVGAAIAISLGAGGLLTASAAGPAAALLTTIAPCRLMDTRPADDNVGTRSTPLGAGEVYAPAVVGSNGNCTIPATATAVSMNIVVLNGTAGSYLTVFPPDQPRPLAASMNWVAGQAPTPNGVVSKLSADGRLGLYNLSGNVDVIIDIVGYYEIGAGGATGPAGATGTAGAAGPRGFSAWNTIPSGTTVIGSQAFDIDAGQINADFQFTIPFPGQAPAVPATSFAPDVVPGTIDESALCTGTSLVPTAPAGRACLYIVTSANISSAQAVLPHLTRTGFLVTWTAPAAGDSYIKFNWAYTAP